MLVGSKFLLSVIYLCSALQTCRNTINEGTISCGKVPGSPVAALFRDTVVNRQTRRDLLLGCHGLPSLKRGLVFYWVAMGYPVLKWASFFLLGCHGLPSLKMGLGFFFFFTGLPRATQSKNGVGFYWVAKGYPV